MDEQKRPNSLIGNNLKLIISILNSKDTKHKVISIFICKILPHKKEVDIYKKKMDEGKNKIDDEKKFIKLFENDINDSNVVNHIFEIKSLWTQLNDSNKKYVIQYMQLLCEISQEYYECYNK